MEGPGTHAIADRLAPLAGRKVESIGGRSRFPLDRIAGKAVTRIYPVGKLLFIELPPCTLRVHFLMWGRYRLNEEIPGKVPKLIVGFDDGSVLRFYASAVALFPSDTVASMYNKALDPLDDSWDPGNAVRLVRGKGKEWICDSLMDQSILPGVGNIIKNEALFAAGIHPASPSKCIPGTVLRNLLIAVRDISFTMYGCDREGRRMHPFLKIYRKKTCPGCGGKVESGRIGSLGRVSYWCPACQVKYRCRETG
jgi:endonuclease-8